MERYKFDAASKTLIITASTRPSTALSSTEKSARKPIWKVGESTSTAGTKKAAGVPTASYATTSAGIHTKDPALTITSPTPPKSQN